MTSLKDGDYVTVQGVYRYPWIIRKVLGKFNPKYLELRKFITMQCITRIALENLADKVKFVRNSEPVACFKKSNIINISKVK